MGVVRRRDGDVLDFDYLKSGARAYLAISGGLDTRVDLGSRATYVIGSLGGVDGRPIAEGDVLPVGPPDGAGGPGSWCRRGPAAVDWPRTSRCGS